MDWSGNETEKLPDLNTVVLSRFPLYAVLFEVVQSFLHETKQSRLLSKTRPCSQVQGRAFEQGYLNTPAGCTWFSRSPPKLGCWHWMDKQRNQVTILLSIAVDHLLDSCKPESLFLWKLCRWLHASAGRVRKLIWCGHISDITCMTRNLILKYSRTHCEGAELPPPYSALAPHTHPTL